MADSSGKGIEIDTASSATTDWSLENRIDVAATWTDLTLNPGARTQIEIGASGSLDPIQGLTTINGLAGDHLLVADQGTTTSQYWTVTPDTIFRGTAKNWITYHGLDQIDIDGGTGDDTFTLLGTAAGTLTSVFAGGGNDTFRVVNPAVGSLGLYGGPGTNTPDYTYYGSGVTVNLASGTAPGVSWYSGVQNVIGSAYADSLTGDAGSNVLSGGGGSDYLFGGDGNDILIGGAGVDNLTGGTGDDLLIGGQLSVGGNAAGLAAIRAESASGRDYATRLNDLTNSGAMSAARANGSYFLTAGTVTDDGATDRLEGDAGQDAFFGSSLEAIDLAPASERRF